MDLPLRHIFGAMFSALAGMDSAGGSFSRIGRAREGAGSVVLILPHCGFFRRQWRDFFAAAAGCLVVAGPWYVAMILRHGKVLGRIIVRHHFSRFTEDRCNTCSLWYFCQCC